MKTQYVDQAMHSTRISLNYKESSFVFWQSMHLEKLCALEK